MGIIYYGFKKVNSIFPCLFSMGPGVRRSVCVSFFFFLKGFPFSFYSVFGYTKATQKIHICTWKLKQNFGKRTVKIWKSHQVWRLLRKIVSTSLLPACIFHNINHPCIVCLRTQFNQPYANVADRKRKRKMWILLALLDTHNQGFQELILNPFKVHSL